MKVLLADDHGLFRDSMAVWLKQYRSDINITFSSTFQEVKEHLSLNTYDLILLDLAMPEMQGIVSIQYFVTISNKAPILIVSADERADTVASCIDVGAAGYIMKSSTGESILEAIKKVLSGEKYIPVNITNKNVLDLSLKKQQVLALIVDGYSNKKISECLHLSEGTVKQYVSQLLIYLDVDNRIQAANKARTILGLGIRT